MYKHLGDYYVVLLRDLYSIALLREHTPFSPILHSSSSHDKQLLLAKHCLKAPDPDSAGDVSLILYVPFMLFTPCLPPQLFPRGPWARFLTSTPTTGISGYLEISNRCDWDCREPRGDQM